MKIWILFSIFMTACGTAAPMFAENPTAFKNEATLQFSVDGVNFVGVAAIPRKKSQTLKINVGKSAERIVINTCAGNPTTISPANPFVFVYEPIHFIEDNSEKPCIMKIGVASTSSLALFGMIDFYGEEVSMPAWITCNRISLRAGGASICQVVTKATTRLVFDEPVLVEALDDCNKIDCKDAICTYEMGKKECGYLFRGLKSGNYHRHTVRGLAPLEN